MMAESALDKKLTISSECTQNFNLSAQVTQPHQQVNWLPTKIYYYKLHVRYRYQITPNENYIYQIVYRGVFEQRA